MGRVRGHRIVLVAVALTLGAAAWGHRNQPREPEMGERHGWIRVEREVAAPVSAVWRAWTTNEGTREYFAQSTNVRLEVGGPFEMYFLMEAPEGSRGSEGCRFLSYIPERMVSFSWNAPPSFAHARGLHTWVVIHLEALDGARTRVVLEHLGWEEMKRAHPDHAQEWDEVRAYFERAWPYVLGNLARRFDEGPRWTTWE